MGTVAWGRAAGGADRTLGFTGNVALVGTVIANAGSAPNDDVLLALNTNPGTNCLGLWRMNEASWNGTAGEVLDAVGSAPGTATGTTKPSTADGLMDRSGRTSGASTQHVNIPYVTGYNFTGPGAVGGWVKPTAGVLVYLFEKNMYAPWTAWGARLYVDTDLVPKAGIVRTAGGTVGYDLSSTATLTDGAWAYIALRWENTTNGPIYLDVYQAGGATHDTRNTKTGVIRAGAGASMMLESAGVSLADEVALYNASTAQSVFDALGRVYPTTGTVACSDSAWVTSTVTRVDWSVSGTGGATVAAVYLNTGTTGSPVWTQVGGANPTSPITGLAYSVSATNPVKIELVPSTDSIGTYTPTLDWVQVTTGSRTPLVILQSGQMRSY